MTRPLDQILKEHGIRFSSKAVRSDRITVRPSDDWVVHQRIVGANSHVALAPMDRVLLSLPVVAIAVSAVCILVGWDIALPLGVVATIVAAYFAIRSFDRLLDVRRHQHAMKSPVYGLDLERGEQYCEFFQSPDEAEVRLVREALEDFLTNSSFASTGARRTA